MSRIASQGTVIMIADNTVAGSVALTSATKAKPCVLTLATGTAPVVGDIVMAYNTGWNSIESMPFKVSAVTGQNVTLEDSDTTGEVDVFNVTPPGSFLYTPTFLELCRSNFTANNPAGATIDVTTLCDTAHRIVAGLPAIGTWTAAGFYDCQDVALDAARGYYRTGEKTILDVRLPDGCGFTFSAIINTFDVTLGINAAVANTIGGQIDGQVHFYKTPPVGGLMVQQAGSPRPPTNRQPEAAMHA